MSRAHDIREAEDQAEREAWQCETCTQPKAENDERYCRHCRMYWEDVDAGLFNDEYSRQVAADRKGDFYDAD